MSDMTHAFTLTGLGKAPFTFLGVDDRHDGCHHCGTGIRFRFHLRSSDGHVFHVGSDCIDKSGDRGLISIAKAEVNRRRREAAFKKREAARLAGLDAERKRNGGLTDWERGQKEVADRQARIDAATADDWAILADFANDLGQASSGPFAFDISNQLTARSIPSDRAISIAIEIVAKQSGRRGSKTFQAAHDELAPKINAAIEAINQEQMK